jgi:hypothetical protein
MSFRDDLVADPVHPITTLAVNGNGGPYFVKIEMERQEAGRFIRELWESIGGCTPRDDEDALREWTDRMRDFRTTYSWCDKEVLIRTHAWTPEADHNTLHDDVLKFLRARGLKL